MNTGIYGREIKICLPVYKLAYSILFVLLLSLVRGISEAGEIGIALDTNIALLAIVFCGDTWEMEYLGKRWEILKLYPIEQRTRAIYRRLAVQSLYLCLLSWIGYWFFYWQRPGCRQGSSPAMLYGMTVLASAVTVLFWGTLSHTIVSLCGGLWAGIGITAVLWFFLSAQIGDKLLGKFNVFGFSFRDLSGTGAGSWGWLWGKGLALLFTAAMLAVTPVILRRKRRMR